MVTISAIVVCYNEGHLLEKCLSSISFCDDILVADLGSTDNSVEVASKFTKNIIFRNRKDVPSCEMVQSEIVSTLKNDWIIFIDPDEVLDPLLSEELLGLFDKIKMDENIGAVTVPWQFYFRQKRLKGTVWGGINKKFFLVNRNRFSFEPIIHYGRKLILPFLNFEIEGHSESAVLHHYWMNSYEVFFRKHFRYLKNEGNDQYDLGRRVGIKELILKPYTEFKYCYITKAGYKDSLTGLFLSMFWAYYCTVIAYDIYRIHKRQKRLYNDPT
ncbi:MAG: glycosyltransferase [Ferruginibacter sp.]